MKPTRLARNLSCASIVALSALALHTPAWGQEAEKPAAPAAADQTPASAAQPAAPAPVTGPAQAAPSPSVDPIPPPPPASQTSPGSGPPPGVPYHYYYDPSGYPGYTSGPTRPVTYRPFMFGVGLGVGSLTYDSPSFTKHETAMAYAVHLGFSITNRWMVLLAMDGSWGQFTFNDRSRALPYGKVSVALSSYTAGAQMFILRWLYARVGLGFACLEWSDDTNDSSDCRGQAGVAAVGAEFLQTRSTALAAELGGFAARFPDAMTIDDRNDVWYHVGANLVLNLF